MLADVTPDQHTRICALEDQIAHLDNMTVRERGAFITAKIERRELFERASRGDRLLIVRVERVYGVEKVYPVNPAAHAIAQIAGTKTIRREDLAIARDVLGFQIAEDPRPRLSLPRSSTVKP